MGAAQRVRLRPPGIQVKAWSQIEQVTPWDTMAWHCPSAMASWEWTSGKVDRHTGARGRVEERGFGKQTSYFAILEERVLSQFNR